MHVLATRRLDRYLLSIGTAVSVLALSGCATSPGLDSVGEAQLLEGMGPHHRAVTTSSAEAQAHFDQGLTWMFAFNHDEAIRSFVRATELDPDCAMAWWGISVASGPQYNHPIMTEERTARAWFAMQKALELTGNVTPVERALIDALKLRNANPEPEDRTALNEAYADAMGKIWEAHPEDADVGTLYAEAMMVLAPWKLYTTDFAPHEVTPRVVATLERVLELDADHPGALHLYIHAVEPSRDPYRALSAADRLRDLVPDSGHLQHMPSHIYVKTGYWDKAVAQNVKAMRADDRYRVRTEVPEVQYGYMTHNSHMRAFAAMMSGRELDAMVAARDMWAKLDDATLERIAPDVDRTMCSVFDVEKRFGRWDAILAERAPPPFMKFTTAVWRAARAVAYAAKKDFPNAQREYEAFRSAVAAIPEDSEAGGSSMRRALEVSDHFVAGEIALQHGNWEEAAKRLERAAVVEDTLSYGEPPQWLQPVRHTLGAVYRTWGRHADAERVYREDLAKWPNNGWSLVGLQRALEDQGKTEEALKVAARYKEAWKHADELIPTSCCCLP